MRKLRVREALGLAQGHLAWLGLVPETPLTIFPPLEKAPKVQDEGCSELVAAQRGLNTAKGHTAGRQSPGGWCPTRAVTQGCGGPHRPSSPGNLSGQHAGGVPMEHIAAHKRPDAFLHWRKGLCYLAQAAGVRAARRWES